MLGRCFLVSVTYMLRASDSDVERALSDVDDGGVEGYIYVYIYLLSICIRTSLYFYIYLLCIYAYVLRACESDVERALSDVDEERRIGLYLYPSSIYIYPYIYLSIYIYIYIYIYIMTYICIRAARMR